MNVRLTSGFLQVTAIALAALSLVANSPVVFLIGWLFWALAVFWPRCPQCKLPAFWQKAANAPDRLLSYALKRSLIPPRACSRCGGALT
jgi:hypothetical protein